ncbi:PREDICTED: girdin [Tarenaya hassleriana]|uniref:girdin n=1 Tax=Tarenaya hassleriana TaxID=28532 RepID=UPI00053C1090|nr:PREDICTED: girdin [Tarenaya hassleriana]
MGCTPSKLDGLPAVSLCRDRCKFLAEALRRSYAVADAHSAYLHSLSTVGEVLHRFFDQAVDSQPDVDFGAGISPDCCSQAVSSSSSSSPVHSLSSSDSDSPPKFDSDSEGERSRGRGCELFGSTKEETVNSGREHDFFASTGCMKNEAGRSVFYSGYGSDSHRNYDSGTRTPPPPPATDGYAWDFINFFESYEFPYSVTAKDSKDKEATRDHDDGSMKKVQKEETICLNQEKNIAGGEKSSRKISEKTKKKDGSVKNMEGTKKNGSAESKCANLRPNISVIAKELQELFMRASEAGEEVSKMFDTAKFRYYYKSSFYQASSNILYAFSPSFLGISSPSPRKTNPLVHKNQNPVEDIEADYRTLSSTLKKLSMWEKKLYQEVKDEEKLRTAHMENFKQLRRMEEKGTTDVRKLEATRTLIQSLSTRLKVSIHMIDKICVMINTLRDEELWPQMKELIHRLSKMWSSMLECHRRQSRIISDTRKLEAITINGNLDISQLELAMELKVQLSNWNQSLSNWIEAQKQCIKALNGWLMRCLMQEPQEQTPDLNEEAPPVFGAINRWTQTLERSTEKEVTEAVYALLTLITRQMKKQKLEMQQRNVMIGDKDVERKLMTMEKEEQKIQRYFVQTLQRRMDVSAAESSVSSNLKSNLEQIFISMENLANGSKQAYDDLYSVCV